jgi:predicted metal-dependent hydrolase
VHSDAVDTHYREGVELIRAGAFFEAHEELEIAWRAAARDERDFFPGLVHVAVAWYQAERSRPIACTRQLDKAARRLAPYAPSHRGLDVDALLTSVRDARARAASGDFGFPPPALPPRVRRRDRWSGADG